jgi:small nuclear ribonucleoprotein (snRNP)-like protein
LTKTERGVALVQVIWALAGILVMVAALWHVIGNLRDTSVQFPTPYQAVLLSNGSVYFGHLKGYGSSHPVLTDVFYVVSQTNPETKQVNNVLVKRGKELHEPDRMYINPNQIVFVETVGTNSTVAQHIDQGPH